MKIKAERIAAGELNSEEEAALSDGERKLLEKRRRDMEKEAQIESDLQHAEELFGITSLNGNKSTSKSTRSSSLQVGGGSRVASVSSISSVKRAPVRDTIATADPQSVPQFDSFLQAVNAAVTTHSSKPFFASRLPPFLKDLCRSLSSAEVKVCTNALAALQDEKERFERSQQKSTKKSKPTINTGTKSKKKGSAYDEYGDYDEYGMEKLTC